MGNDIYIALDAKEGAYMSVLGHELYHYLKANNKAGAKLVRDVVMEALQKDKNFDYNKEMDDRRELYGKDMTDDYIEEELIADCMFDVFNEETVSKIVNENRSLAQKIKDFIDEFISVITGNSDKFARVGNYFNADDLQKISDLFLSELDKTVKNNTDSVKTDGEVKYSINEQYVGDIQEWFSNGCISNESFILGSTSDVLQGLGARENDIYMNGDKINTILKEHPEMTISEIKKIPQILENPVIVLKSKNDVKNNSRLVMFGTVIAKNGKPTLCILDLMPIENKLYIDDMQKTISAYTKTNSENNIKKFFEESEVLYTTKNKKVATNLLTRVGFYAPTDLLISGYIGNITYENEKVNIEGKPFNEIFKYDNTTNSIISENNENDTIKFSKNGYINNFSQRDKTVESLTNYLNKKYPVETKINNVPVEFVDIEKSRAPGSYETFYVNFSVDDGDNTFTIRYSGHWGANVDVHADSTISNSDVNSMADIKSEVDKLLKDYMDENYTADGEWKTFEMREVKFSKSTDSDGNALSEQQNEFFKDSKVRDEDGNLRVVYHGTVEDFTVFDKSKGRNNADIQGSFFSPWEIDAQGYGGNVKAYYLNISNPASESVGYKAIHLFQGQNDVGIKARKYLEKLGYDGVNNENEEYIAFYPEQIKLVDNLNPTDNEDIRYSKSDYSYDTLISKPDMSITVIDDSKVYEPTKETRKYIVDEAIKNAVSVGKTNKNGNAVVYVKDIDTDVIVSSASIRHGLDRRFVVNAPIMLKVGNVLQNSIIINELNPKKESVSNSYILLGVSQNKFGRKYVVRFVVNKITNGISSVDVLYAVNAKKETAALLPEITEKSATLTVSTISISNLLDIVKNYQPETLSEDVLKHYGIERGNSEIEKGLRYSLNDTKTVDEIVKENEDLRSALDIAKRELKLTEGHTLNEQQLKSMATGILKNTHSSYSNNMLTENLTKIFDYIANNEQPSYDVAMDAMADLSKAVLSESSVVNHELYDEYESMRKYFRETAISLSDSAKSELADGYNSFRKNNFGRIKLSNDGINLDNLWNEISEMYPEFLG